MALIDLLNNPLDTTQADARAFMQRVQGNILKGHARAHTAHVFMTFNADVQAARAWIADALSDRLTSAQAQDQQTQLWKATRDLGAPFFAFFLSYQGYVQLGIADDVTPIDIYFRAGMKVSPPGAGSTVADRPDQWEVNFQGRIDAMVLAADDDPGPARHHSGHALRLRVLLLPEPVAPQNAVNRPPTGSAGIVRDTASATTDLPV